MLNTFSFILSTKGVFLRLSLHQSSDIYRFYTLTDFTILRFYNINCIYHISNVLFIQSDSWKQTMYYWENMKFVIFTREWVVVNRQGLKWEKWWKVKRNKYKVTTIMCFKLCRISLTWSDWGFRCIKIEFVWVSGEITSKKKVENEWTRKWRCWWIESYR